MPLNERGTLTAFSLPPEAVIPDELKGAAKEYRELVAKRRAAQHRLDTLARDRARAIARDRLALAKALREGGEDPGDQAVEKIDKDMANTHRIIESLEIAIEDAEQELIGVVDEHQAKWIAEADEEIDADVEAYSAAVDELEAKRTKLTESVALKRFFNTFPEHGYRPGHWHVFGLISPNGDPFRWDQVTEALRNDAEVAQSGRKPKPEQAPDGPPKVYEHALRVEDPGLAAGSGTYVDHKMWQSG